MMKVTQTISAGKLTGSYLSSWNNELQLSFGNDKVELKMDEDAMRELHGELTERIQDIDKERLDTATAEAEQAADEEAEVNA